MTPILLSSSALNFLYSSEHVRNQIVRFWSCSCYRNSSCSWINLSSTCVPSHTYCLSALHTLENKRLWVGWGGLSLSPQCFQDKPRRFNSFWKKFCKVFKLSERKCYLLSAPAKGSIKQQRMAAGTVSTGTQKLGTIFQSRASPLQPEASDEYIQCYGHRLTPANQERKKKEIIKCDTQIKCWYTKLRYEDRVTDTFKAKFNYLSCPSS